MSKPMSKANMNQPEKTQSRGFKNFLVHDSLFLPLLLLWLLTLLLVSPKGEFPLNDDWIYGQTVQTLLDDHTYVRHPFGKPTAVAQVLWGALFAAPFGFSFIALRLSTLVLSLLGSWFTAKCARACGLSRHVALLFGCVVLSNPLNLNLSYTFMTDVPFCMATTLSAYFYIKALRSEG
jgi:hypothetical protein